MFLSDVGWVGETRANCISMFTLSTGYQRPHPRIRARSWPFLLRIATTFPMGQFTRVQPRNACSHRAALISLRFADCMVISFTRCGSKFGLECKQVRVWGCRAEEIVEVHQNIDGQGCRALRMIDAKDSIIGDDEWVGK